MKNLINEISKRIIIIIKLKMGPMSDGLGCGMSGIGGGTIRETARRGRGKRWGVVDDRLAGSAAQRNERRFEKDSFVCSKSVCG